MRLHETIDDVDRRITARIEDQGPAEQLQSIPGFGPPIGGRVTPALPEASPPGSTFRAGPQAFWISHRHPRTPDALPEITTGQNAATASSFAPVT